MMNYIKKCNCKECSDIREDIERAEIIIESCLNNERDDIRDDIERADVIIESCLNTDCTYNQKLLRDIADRIYKSQGFKTFYDIYRQGYNDALYKLRKYNIVEYTGIAKDLYKKTIDWK